MSNKATQRKKLKALRSSLSHEAVELASEAVCIKAFELMRENGFKSVHLYLPIAKNNEIKTWKLIDMLLEDGVKVSTSVYSHNKSLRHVYLQKNTEYQMDRFGIPVPSMNYTQSADEDYDCIIIPLLGFDEELNRIGYGMGVYDGFLKSYPDSFKLGLGYEKAKVERVITEPHDVKLNAIITDTKLYN